MQIGGFLISDTMFSVYTRNSRLGVCVCVCVFPTSCTISVSAVTIYVCPSPLFFFSF